MQDPVFGFFKKCKIQFLNFSESQKPAKNTKSWTCKIKCLDFSKNARSNFWIFLKVKNPRKTRSRENAFFKKCKIRVWQLFCIFQKIQKLDFAIGKAHRVKILTRWKGFLHFPENAKSGTSSFQKKRKSGTKIGTFTKSWVRVFLFHELMKVGYNRTYQILTRCFCIFWITRC